MACAGVQGSAELCARMRGSSTSAKAKKEETTTGRFRIARRDIMTISSTRKGQCYSSAKSEGPPAEMLSREVQMLFFQFGARANELRGGGAQRFRDIFVRGQPLQVQRVQHGKHVERDVQWGLRIVHQVPNDYIVFPECAVAGDQAKNFIRQVRHGGKGFNFLVRKARRLQHGALHDLVAVTNQRPASLGAAFHPELD